jgi:hypothetical protein
VQFDPTVAAGKPAKERQTQTDGGRVESIDGLGQFHSEGIVGVKVARDADQHLGKVGVDAPAADLIAVSQGVARD